MNDEKNDGENVANVTKPLESEPSSKEDSKEKKACEVDIKPEISAFFENPEISPAAFFRVINNKKKKRFLSNDQASALELMHKCDGSGERLWALLSQTKLPEAVDAWIWTAVQSRLKKVMGDDFDPQEYDPGRILKTIRDALRTDLKSEDDNVRERAENWLRIGVCWLTERKNLRPWEVTSQVYSAIFQDDKKAFEISKRAVTKGKDREFRLAVAMAALGHEVVEIAQNERDKLKQELGDLRHRYSDARASIDQQRLKAEELQSQLVARQNEVVELKAKLLTERQHWGHDLSEIQAGQGVLLRERVAPLISDAIDALEIDPPFPHVALKRLKAVLSLINEEKT